MTLNHTDNLISAVMKLLGFNKRNAVVQPGVAWYNRNSNKLTSRQGAPTRNVIIVRYSGLFAVKSAEQIQKFNLGMCIEQ